MNNIKQNVNLESNNTFDFESAELRKHLENFIIDKIKVEKLEQAKYEISLPMYKLEGDPYRIYLIMEDNKYYLSDGGATYAELDKIFELEEPDVIKNLVAILRQYGCKKIGNCFAIECSSSDIHQKYSFLVQAISFMLNMKIFYV
jgi:hypothetical protein